MTPVPLPGPVEVHLWHIGPDSPATDGPAGPGHLVGDGHPVTRTRASRVRAVLAAYLELDPSELVFEHGPWGKPALGGPAAASGLEFNLTHSAGLALLAVARGRPVGVDVERVRPMRDARRIADRYFSADERRDVERVAGTDAEALAFLRCWTRKEAYVKAIGKGMWHPLDAFTVTCLPDAPARLTWCRDDPSAPDNWSLVTLEPAAGFVGAVATRGPCVVVERSATHEASVA